MSYLNKQIQNILEFDTATALITGGTMAVAGAIGYAGIKHVNKISCQEPRWSNYVNMMETAIKQSKREGNLKTTKILQDQLKKDIEFCKNNQGGV